MLYLDICCRRCDVCFRRADGTHVVYVSDGLMAQVWDTKLGVQISQSQMAVKDAYTPDNSLQQVTVV